MIRGLKIQIREHGLEDSVTLLPFQSDVSGLLEACDIVAISSQSYESFCLVAVEAFRFAKPIVGTTVGAIPEIAPHGLGAILCDPDDVDSFSEALFRLSTDKALYAEYAQLSGARFELFGSEKMIQSYQKSLKGEL
jgi:glycosyltransferase involved in cell wall biosynthesis